MHRTTLALLLNLGLLAATACGTSDPTTQSSNQDDGDDYDSEELAEFRSAIPSPDRLAAVAPGEQPDPNALTKNPKDADFAYGYALVRLDGEDVSTGAPVIWGGATPLSKADDESDRSGTGVTLWDFEANRRFETDYDPDFDADAAADRGRFVMLFGRNDEDGARFKFNVAVFRDFVSKDGDRPDAIDADYFYGHFKGENGNLVDFVDWSMQADLCDEGTDTCFDKKSDASNAAEQLDFRAAFLNRSIGRAEATVSAGDLTQTVNVTECWDEDIDRAYIGLVVDGATIAEEGACEEPFEQTIEALGVPTLDDIDPALLERMSCVAASGTDCKDK